MGSSTNPLAMIMARAGMGYVGVWDRGGIEINVDHLRRRSGELHGELVVSAAVSPAGRGLLHRASFNLSSSTARERLAKSLYDRSRVGDPGIWRDMLEDFCGTVLEAERAGRPVVAVGSLEARGDHGYLVDPMIPKGKVTILFAAGGTGKSYLAILVAVSVATGIPVLGWPVLRGEVLYLDWETDEWEVDERVKRVSAGLGVPPPAILYRSCAGPLEDMAEQASKMISERGIALVIVDSVGMATGTAREGGSAEEGAIRLFGAFRYLGASVLAIDHVAGEDVKRPSPVSKPYGSIYKVNLARSVWELRGTPTDEAVSHLALYHRKVNRGKLQAPVGIAVEHHDDSVVFTRETITDDGLVMGLTASARVQRALQRGALKVADIAEETGLAEGTVRVALSRGRGTMFVRTADGTWGLLSRGDD